MTIYILKNPPANPEGDNASRYIEAVQWTGGNVTALRSLAGNTALVHAPRWSPEKLYPLEDSLLLCIWDFPTWLERGDWIVRDGAELDVWPAICFAEKFEAAQFSESDVAKAIQLAGDPPAPAPSSRMEG